jgi:hypothetical protein
LPGNKRWAVLPTTFEVYEVNQDSRKKKGKALVALLTLLLNRLFCGGFLSVCYSRQLDVRNSLNLHHGVFAYSN